jgi:hypothetical protein
MRAFAGIIVGLIVGFVATIAIGLLVGIVYPSSASVDLNRPEQIIEAFAAMPFGAKLGLMLAWFGGALVGAIVAKLIARKGWVAWTVTGLVVAYVIANVFVLPMPGWMQALSIVAPLLGGLLGNHLVASRDTDPAPAMTTDGDEDA